MAGVSAHACVQCAGALVIALHEEGSVDLDYVELHPGEWGKFNGLPVKKVSKAQVTLHLLPLIVRLSSLRCLLQEAVDFLQRMGVDSIRTGGTYVKADTDQTGKAPGYLWKKLRGPRHLRPVREQAA